MRKLSFLFAALVAGVSFAGEYDPPADVELVDLTTPTSGSVVEDTNPYDSSQWRARNAFDGSAANNNNTRWLFRLDKESDSFFTYKFATPTLVNAFQIFTAYSTREPKVWQIYGSNDNAEWILLDSEDMSAAAVSNWGKKPNRLFRFQNRRGYVYYKFVFPKGQGYSNLIQIQEIEFYGISSLIFGNGSVCANPDGSVNVSATLEKGNADLVLAVASKDAESEPSITSTIGTSVAEGSVADGTLSGFAENKTYVLSVSAENETDYAECGLGAVYTGVLTIEKVRDADEMTTRPAIVRVSRAAADPYDLSIDYTVTSVKATAGVDYVIPAGAVTIKAGETSADVELVPIFNMSLAEDATVTIAFATKDVTCASADQSQDVTIVNCAYDITKRYVDAAVAGGGQRAGTDWDDAYSSIVEAVNAVNLANLPATIYVNPGTYETTAQLKLNGAIKIIGWTGIASDVVITNRTAYSNEDASKDNRVVHMNDAAAGVYNVTLGGGGCSRNGSGGSSVYIGANGGVVSNCVVSCTRSGSYHNIGAVWMDGANALVTHTIVRDIEKYNVVDPNWGANKWALGIHAKKGRVENCLVRNARNTCTRTTNAANNSAGGIYAASGVKVVNCTFVDCHGTECGGIYADAGAEVINCVVADSKPWQVIDGVYTKESNIPVAGDPSAFVNCATDGDVAINDTCVIGTENTFFAAYSDGDLAPKVAGPLYNTGMTPTGWAKSDGRLDLAGAVRFVGKAVDIGAYEQQKVPGLMLLVR